MRYFVSPSGATSFFTNRFNSAGVVCPATTS
jgi:hypothetical protein